MGLFLPVGRMSRHHVVESENSDGSPKLNRYLATWSTVVEEAKALFGFRSGDSNLIYNSQPAVRTIELDEPSGPFVAKENFKRGADAVAFGDELYRWRAEFNIRPMFIAMRDIHCGEDVMSNPADLENSDLLTHWELTYRPKER